MSKIYTLNVVLWLTSLSFSFCDITTEPVALLSYPRSGNTWSRYCLEYLTKRPTYAFDARLLINQPLGNLSKLHYDKNAPKIIKYHLARDVKDEYLILLVRNYIEVLCSHIQIGVVKSFLTNSIKNEFATRCTLSNIEIYMKNLRLYNDWPKNKRLLIYYEDLIDHPKKTLMQMCSFLKVSTKSVDKFIANLPRHKKLVFSLYAAHHRRPRTRGKTKHFSNQLPIKLKQRLTKIIKNNDPELFNRYLSVYAEN